MSYLDQIGVPRSRRGGRRGQQSQPTAAPVHTPPPVQEIPSYSMYPPQEQYPQMMAQQPFNVPQVMPQIQQPMGMVPPQQPMNQQQLLEKLEEAEKKNAEMKNELVLHKKKIEFLENQMLVFFGKIDRYERALKESTNPY